ncbi:MAG TPA: polyprenyl synthetase family protein, partial [Candidatus Levybacteria bacterium]|nr:polyprenyl synthetase family protein [Candidatus Levybacteria bacterium]
VPECMPQFTKMQRFLCIGQFYEMIHWGKQTTPEISEKIARFKSAQYSFMYPLQLGLQIAQRDNTILDKYADATGLAFQIRDDWLDVSQDTTSGKDGNLDSKNSVSNIVQNLLKENTNDVPSTKIAVEKLLGTYKSQALASLDQIQLSTAQKNSLLSLLEFSTTL